MSEPGVEINGHRSPLLTKLEAAQFLRLDASAPDDTAAAMDRLRKAGKLRGTKIGKCVHFHIDDLNQYIEDQRK